VIDYGIVNEEGWERVPRRIQNRRESRVGPSRNSFGEAKGRERIEKERGGGIGIKLFFPTSSLKMTFPSLNLEMKVGVCITCEESKSLPSLVGKVKKKN
jgi:hypothetical protein